MAKEEQHNDEVGMSRYTKVVAAYSLESQGLRVGASIVSTEYVFWRTQQRSLLDSGAKSSEHVMVPSRSCSGVLLGVYKYTSVLKAGMSYDLSL